MIATMVGNYPKIPNPPEKARLRIAISRLDRQLIDREELARVADEVTREVIDEEIEAGLDLVTDGMIRWEDGQTYLARELGGIEIGGLIRYFDTNTYYRQPVVTGRVRWQGPITVSDFEFARRRSARPVKPVLTGPLTLAHLSRDEFYSDPRALVLDLARALREELKALGRAGATLAQIDEPWLTSREAANAAKGVVKGAAKGAADGAEGAATPSIGAAGVELLQDAWNAMTEGVELPLHLYTYFGDVRPSWPAIRDLRGAVAVVGLDLTEGPAGSAGWECLAEGPLPFGIGAGIMDARNTRMEDEDALVETIRKLARLVPPEKLYLNPSAGLEFLPRERAREKLTRLARAVRRAEELVR